MVGDLRAAGVSAVTAFTARSMKAQLRQADGTGCHFAAIIGAEELEQGFITLRDLRTAQQEPVDFSKLVDRVKITGIETL